MNESKIASRVVAGISYRTDHMFIMVEDSGKISPEVVRAIHSLPFQFVDGSGVVRDTGKFRIVDVKYFENPSRYIIKGVIPADSHAWAYDIVFMLEKRFHLKASQVGGY